jgi:FkbM family methyltransferase
MVNKFFIDAGANDGCSVRAFRSLYDKNTNYYIFSFEADPYFNKFFAVFDKHTYFNKAVWIENAYLDFYFDRNKLKVGGSLIKEKKTSKLEKKNPIKIEAIDFSKWLMNTFSKSDEIILKMDIEGAEYEVLNKMIKDGAMSYINELWIEWHWRKIKLSEDVHNDLVKKINVPMKKWCAIKWRIDGK